MPERGKPDMNISSEITACGAEPARRGDANSADTLFFRR